MCFVFLERRWSDLTLTLVSSDCSKLNDLCASLIFMSRSVFSPSSNRCQVCAADVVWEEDAVRRKLAGTSWMLRKNGYRQKEGEEALTTLGLTHRLRHMDIHGVPRTDFIVTFEDIFNVPTEVIPCKRLTLVSIWRIHERHWGLWSG